MGSRVPGKRNRFIGGVFAMLLLVALSPAAFAQVVIGVSVNTAPPPLPVYAQPACPGVGYLWAPGYWAWDDSAADYYWVPGTWVMAPQPGLLWTPGWWGWGGGAYAWHAGYWGPQVGFYGGVNYGFGYSGNGYGGGYWRGNQFYYNRSVNNVTNITNVTNIYNSPPPGGGESHVSFNGGQGGVRAQPTAAQRAYAQTHHVGPTAAQTQQERAAAGNQQLRASVNHGKPEVAATARPGEFSGKDVVAAVAAGGAVHA
ncbi:MAG: YXWGXW repeat-containing protein, partial [Steroidobacteraceae bacterium]